MTLKSTYSDSTSFATFPSLVIPLQKYHEPAQNQLRQEINKIQKVSF